MAPSITFSLLLCIFISIAANSKPVTSSRIADNYLEDVTSSDKSENYLVSSRPVTRTTEEHQTHFRFYWHDIVAGPNPTAVEIVAQPAAMKSNTHFGSIWMFDDPLTTGPNLTSTEAGRAQGFYSSAALDKFGLLQAMNFVFTEGKYKGSTISIFGHNELYSAVREMPIIGGSGLFRLARGYVEASTYSSDEQTADAIVEYNVYVNHY